MQSAQDTIETVVIKVGTEVITTPDGNLDAKVIRSIVRQIAQLRKHVSRVVLVTSGAVGAGRARYGRKKRPNETVQEKQKYASAGQARLMAEYDRYFEAHEIVVNQILVTRQEIEDKLGHQNIQAALEEIFSEDEREDGVISVPIVNENDTVAVDELDKKFGDNDLLAALVAKMIGAQRVLILSSTSGILQDLSKPETRIPEIPAGSTKHHQYVKQEKTGNGSGGAVSKVAVAEDLAASHIQTTIAHGRDEDVILRVILDDDRDVGTTFLPVEE